MKKSILLAGMLAVLTGCTSSYWNDRAADAGDIMTATAGIGGGITLHAGPLHAGLGCYHDVGGVRGGKFGDLLDKYDADGTTEWTVYGKEQFLFGRRESKNIQMRQHLWIPMMMIPKASAVEPLPLFKPFYTQLDLSIAFFPGFRLGMNPGEFADFMLGFTTLDFFADDEATLEAYNAEQELKMTEEEWEKKTDESIMVLEADKTEKKAESDAIAKEVKDELREGKAILDANNSNPQHDTTTSDDPTFDDSDLE